MQLLSLFKDLTLHPKNARELKGLILQLAVHGKLTAKWRAEHPDVENASALYEKIQEDKAELVKKSLEENIDLDKIKELVNEGPIINVLFTKGVVEEDNKKLPKEFELNSEEVSAVYNEENVNFIVVKVNKIIPPEPMKLSEAKGRVINDFQEYLDQEWIKELKQQYPVIVNKRVLKKLIKQNQN